MKSRLIQIATLLLLSSGAGLAGAAEPATTPPPRIEAPAPARQPAESAAQQPTERPDRLAWQRVGSPTTQEG